MKKILVIGDSILDHYVHGKINRINPEAPHSVILDFEREEFKLGGALNVALGIRELTSDEDIKIHYFGATSPEIREILSVKNISSLEELNTEVLVKTRYCSGGHILLRLDYGQKYSFDDWRLESFLYTKLIENHYDLVVISDYNKNTINKSMIQFVYELTDNVLYDIKTTDNIPESRESNLNIIYKCNESEFKNNYLKLTTTMKFNRINFSKIDENIHLRKLLNNTVVETRGGEGYVIHSGPVDKTHFPPIKSVVADVVGAGDSFLCGMAYSFLTTGEWNVEAMASLGNYCASKSVSKFGTYAVKKSDL